MRNAAVIVLLAALTAACGPDSSVAPPGNSESPTPGASTPSTDAQEIPTSAPTRNLEEEIPRGRPETPRPTSTPGPTATPGFPFVRYPSLEDVSRTFNGAAPAGILIYRDVNGDAEDDLIIFTGIGYGTDGDGLFLWDTNHYVGPIDLRSGWHESFLEGTRLDFADWTGDGVPEVVIDGAFFDHMGTGMNETWWETRVLHCMELECHPIWEGIVASVFQDDNWGGVCASRLAITHQTSSGGSPQLRVVTHHFRVFGCGEMGEEEWAVRDHLRVERSETITLAWDGYEFVEVSRQVARLEDDIPSDARLAALSNSGTAAVVEVEFETRIPANGVCHLLIDGVHVGPTFGCRSTFTKVDWRDITGDGQEDVVVEAFSGATAPETDFYEEPCAHIRLLAFSRRRDTGWTQIANVVGCVVSEDLFGVRVEDYDNDSRMEVVAAANPTAGFGDYCDCPFLDSHEGTLPSPDALIESCRFFPFTYEVDIYEWDGSAFVH